MFLLKKFLKGWFHEIFNQYFSTLLYVKCLTTSTAIFTKDKFILSSTYAHMAKY